MELFFAQEVEGGLCRLDAEESAHCVRVLRHREGDELHLIDGAGTLLRCTLVEASPKEALARIEERIPRWHDHPYHLNLAVCPTKNMDRYEWMAEKATEVGLDQLSPVFGERSERRVLKPERLERILRSATKQSLKARVPELAAPVSVMDFIDAQRSAEGLKLIACCFDEGEPRRSITELLRGSDEHTVTILIGPEGDFSPEEARAARAAGFRPVHLGASRLRTETAALVAAPAVYLERGSNSTI